MKNILNIICLISCLVFVGCDHMKEAGGSMAPSPPGVSDPIPSPAPIPSPTIPPPTLSEITDLRGDLMIYLPELAPQCPQDPVTLIRCNNSREQANGVMQGWVWAIMIYRYPKEQRERIYREVQSQGWTYVPVHVACDPTNGFYHGLYPIDCNGIGGDPGTFGNNSGITYGQRQQEVIDELHAHGLRALCAGVGSFGGLAWGVSPATCDASMTDWDNFDTAAARIGMIHSTFPSGPVFVEMGDGRVVPQPDGFDPIMPTATNGPQWVAAIKSRYPRFQGVFYDFSPRDANAFSTYAQDMHKWWGTAQEVLFETDTFRKHWQGGDPSGERAFNDTLLARAPWIKGCMSGC